jgi:tRNA(Met) cytidine acetyltransferase
MQQRQCVVLFGDRAWSDSSTCQLLADFNADSLLCLSDEPIAGFPTLKIKQAQNKLGQEFDAVVFDGLLGLLPDSLGQSMGTLNAGGVFILWLPIDNNQLYSQRFRRVVNQFNVQSSVFHCVQQGELLPELRVPVQANYDVTYRTADQEQAIKAIFKVVEGHRRRPLVISADRGRGKSAVLGMAAAQLLLVGRRRIILTAPSLAAVEPVFRHAALLLEGANQSRGLIEYDGAELCFIAPDGLLEDHHQADLLLVDEAAVIPSPMLAEMLERFSRLVFATTLHGYEGTGRGFAVRFQALLNERAPGWRHTEMVEPVRWCSDDTLEAFSFEALLLNAEPVEDDLISDAQLVQCSIELLDKQSLLEDESLLRELFGLMVLAHYRTRPSDLQLLLDSDDISVYVMRYQGHIVASVWLVNEGPLMPDLSEAISRGERRLKGHLLPQSLLAHSGEIAAGTLRYQRVLRIAVHPALQRQGFASASLAKVLDEAKSRQLDIVGASFSADIDVMAFWQDSGFSVVRLGTQRDEVSGEHAVTLLRACSTEGELLVNSAKKRFEQQWPDLLAMQFNQLETKTVLALSRYSDQQQCVLAELDKRDVMRFAYGHATYESCQVAIRAFVASILNSPAFFQLPQQHQQLLVMRVLQLNSVVDVVKKLGFNGKSTLIAALRQALAELLVSFAAEDNIIAAFE